jgi:hypothetical protein
MLAGVLYASQESHYSVFKAARMYRMPAVKVRMARLRPMPSSAFHLGIGLSIHPQAMC